MANDRMYLRCKACGGWLPLGKHLMDGWYNAPTGESLQEWIDKHAPVWNHEGEYDETKGGHQSHAVFEICYESDDDFVEKANAAMRADQTGESK